MNVNEIGAVIDGVEWLVSVQDPATGGWNSPENTEVASEAMQTMLLTGELTNTVTVPAHSSVGFVISNYFPKMLVPDTYTITTTVEPTA